jgi:succinate dehydrogenase / fumarate reductase flavoprotein subunit
MAIPSNKLKVAIVGGGLAGLAAAMKAAEHGYAVDLYSVVPVKRSHSVCAQGGINGAVNTKGEGDSPWQHFDDSVYGGDFLANQSVLKEMCEAAPSIIYLFDRIGVPFNRTSEGLLEFRRFGGTKVHRTAHAGASTGQQLLYALDEQVRRFEASGKITKYENYEFLEAIIDDNGVTRGIVCVDLDTMQIVSRRADAVIVATGGPGLIFGKSTNSTICTGSAAGALYQQGVHYANGEFIQVHPTAIPGEDKLRLISESVRGEGGRVWVYKDGKPFYFLEEKYPSYGNLVPRDIATREIFSIVYDDGLGIDGKPMVYLDVSHIPPDLLKRKLGGVLEIYEKFVGEDPYKVPMKIFPGVHYSMGGLYIDQHHMSNIPGLLAAGEVDYQYHGANRLGANSLVSCVFGGFRSAATTESYLKGLQTAAADLPSTIFDKAEKKLTAHFEELKNKKGTENPFRLGQEMGEWMRANCTIVRHNDKLQKTEEKLVELAERYNNISVPDTGAYSNQPLLYSYQLKNMLVLARVICKGALLRDESRGAHYKPAFAKRDDERFLKTTVAKHTPDGPQITYEEVDVSFIKPRPRDYSKSQ